MFGMARISSLDVFALRSGDGFTKSYSHQRAIGHLVESVFQL